MRIIASAPGKIVVTGEYAVLVGAPALVAALDRRARCTMEDTDAGGWTFTTHGFAPDALISRDALLRGPLLPGKPPPAAGRKLHVLALLRRCADVA